MTTAISRPSPRLVPSQSVAALLPLALTLLFTFADLARAQNDKRPTGPVVRVIYLVPADREVRDDYVKVLTAAVRHLQVWYRDAMSDGTTFSLLKSPVEVVQSDQVSSWYSTNPLGGDPIVWFFNNVASDAFAHTGGGFLDPDNIWVIYIDTDQACGQLVGATSGVAVLSANDLRGLSGEQTIALCPGETPDTAGVCRWVGGLGHEVGHALLLPHPPGCDQGEPTCEFDALMYLGFRNYPNTFLLEEDRLTLSQSGFFSPVKLRKSLPDCSDLRHGR